MHPVILLAVLALALLLFSWARRSPGGGFGPLIKTLLVLGAGAALVLLTVRFHPSFALLAGLPLLQRALAAARAARARTGPTPGRSSEVSTQYLRMSIDHDSGVMSGVVLEGRHAGRRVEDLSGSEILDLLAECRLRDAQSAGMLETYLDRTQGPGWRQSEDPGRESSGAGNRSEAGSGGPMTEQQALEVLGLRPGASKTQVVEAHRRLMQRLHPDRGGSDFLAAQINRAKEILLG